MLFLLLACQDATLSVKRDPPSVTILEPADGARLAEGTPVVFYAVAGDDATDPRDLQYGWAVGDRATADGVLTVTADGATWALAEPLAVGAYTATVTVADEDGLSGGDAVDFEVVDNQPPTVTFVTPADGAALTTCAPLTVTVFATDPESPSSELGLAFTGLPASATPPTAPAADGYATFDVADFASGAVSLEVTATDPSGETGSDTVAFTVADCVQDVCNGVDDDGDGLVDEDAATATWYADADGDGYGDPESTAEACDAPPGHVGNPDDCDDDDGAVNPGAVEVCNGVDDDCDDEVDEDAGYLVVGLPAAGELHRVDPDGSGASRLATGAGSVSDLDPGTTGAALYVGQWDTPVVRAWDPDGSAATRVYGGHGAGGQGVGVDEAASRLFWGEYYGDLWVGSPDGSATPSVLVPRAAVQSAIASSYDGIGVGVEVDPANAMVYFFTRSNASFSGRWILRVGYDGSGLEALRNIESTCMDLDLVNGAVWFADTLAGVNQLWKMDLDGSGATWILDLPENGTCSGVWVDGAGDRVYFLQSEAGTVWSARLDGSDVVELASGLPDNQGLAWVDCPS